MIIKVGEIVNTKESFDSLIEKKIPFGTNFKLSKLIIEINTILEMYEKKRQKLFQTYGEEIEVDGKKQIQIKSENMEVYFNELNEILLENADLTYEPIYIEDLVYFKNGEKEEDSVALKEMIPLVKFFKSKEDETEA